MAIFCLAESLADLKARFAKIVVGYTRDQKPVHAGDLDAHGAMTVLLKDALKPNLVQTLENNPAFIHGGPFGNIAHGCNSVIATKAALKLADYVVTEAGFGADLGAEKFIDIKCRKSGLRPDVAVLVATMRALKFHGGADLKELTKENLPALEKGIANLERHINNVRNHYGLPCVVAINHFASDTDAEIALLKKKIAHHDAPVVVARHWADGGAGAEELARTVVDVIERVPRGFPARLRRRRHAVGQDGEGREDDLRRVRGDRRQQGARADQEAAGRGLRALSGVRREDAVFVLDRSAAARRAVGPRRQHPRGAARGRRRVRRDGLRRRHDDAGAAEGAVGGEDRHHDDGKVVGLFYQRGTASDELSTDVTSALIPSPP